MFVGHTLAVKDAPEVETILHASSSQFIRLSRQKSYNVPILIAGTTSTAILAAILHEEYDLGFSDVLEEAEVLKLYFHIISMMD